VKAFLIQLGIMLAAFLVVWFFIPSVTAGIEQWPEWLRDSNMQFLLSLIVSLVLAFNPGTVRFVRNTVVIKGQGNQVIQGRRSAGNNNSVTNTARITGGRNKVEQG